MKWTMNYNNYNTLFFALISILLFFAILKWIYYLFQNHYIEKIQESFRVSGNVNIPINTTKTCNNMCGPLARCSISGEQCSSDEDCYGCHTMNDIDQPIFNYNLQGANDSGKSIGTIPKYSTLTSDFTNHAKIIEENPPENPLYLSYNVNIWKTKYNQGMNLFQKRYNVPGSVVYPDKYTLSGEFQDDGVFAANA